MHVKIRIEYVVPWPRLNEAVNRPGVNLDATRAAGEHHDPSCLFRRLLQYNLKVARIDLLRKTVISQKLLQGNNYPALTYWI